MVPIFFVGSGFHLVHFPPPVGANRWASNHAHARWTIGVGRATASRYTFDAPLGRCRARISLASSAAALFETVTTKEEIAEGLANLLEHVTDTSTSTKFAGAFIVGLTQGA